MPEEFTSPEEKLLKLIRGERKPKFKAHPEKAVISERIVQAKEDRSYVKFINISLIAILIIIAAVLIFDVINFNLKRPELVAEIAPKAEERQEPQLQPSQELSVDPKLLGSRDLFKASAAAVSPGAVPQASYDKLKELSLKGIIAGEKPQAIIEDEKNKKSYFLYKGESVNNIKVEDIQSDRVILRVNGEVLELTL